MAITRIQNNQITDNTIQANAKVTPGSITGNLFASSVTLNSNITILGNLTVSNNYTQLNSVNTYIGDPLVVFNNGYVGTPSYDVGLLVNRNLYATPPFGSVNAAFVWKEADTAFEALMTTETGTTAGAINNSGYANVKVGNLTAVSTTITGGFTIAGSSTFNGPTQINNTLGVTGITSITNTTQSTSSSTGALIVSGGVGVAKDIQSGGNIFINSSSATTGVNTGALQVTNGGAYIAGNLWVGGNINFTPNSVSVISGNSAQFFGNAAGFGALYAGISSGYVVQPQTVIQASSNFNNYAQINHQNINGGNAASTDFVATANNGNANDTYIDMGINSSGFNQANQTLSYPNDGYLYVQGNTTTGGGNLLLGTGQANNIFFVTNGQNTNNLVMQITSGNVVQVVSTIASTSTSTGALQVAGGAGIAGAVYAGSIQNTPIGSTTASSGAFTTITSSSTIIAGGNVVANSGTASTTTASGALVVVGGAGVSGALNIGGATNIGGITSVTNSTASTSSSTGALVVTGGTGIGGNLYVGQNTTIAGNLTVQGTLTYINTTQEVVSGVEIVAGNLVANSGTASSSTTSGALVVTGGAGISGAVNIGGALTNAGVHTSNGNIVAASGTASTNTTTGALVVVGGAGVSGAIYAGSIQNTPIGSTTPSTGAFTTLTSTATFIASGNIVAGSGTASTNTTTGALVVTGGAGVSGAINAGTLTVNGATQLSSTLNVTSTATVNGNLVAAATTTSTSTTTGALVVSGGVGTAGNIYSGGNHTAANGLYSTGAFNGGYADGIVVDYTSGLGRISVGSADGLKVYNNGPAGTELFVIDQSGNIVIPATTTSTSTSTGALTVKGGVGIAGTIVAGGNIVAGSGTNTTSTATGAMTVVGGVGVSGNLFVGGGVTLNSAKTANYDVTINGKNDNTLFWARSGNAYDQIVLGNSATTSTLVTGAKVIINTTDSIMVPAGTNAQRPGNAGGTDTAGMVRFNTTSANLEYYNGTGWMNTGTVFTIIADDQLTGNGSTSYTLGGSVSTNGALVSINGVIQIPTLAYSISGTTITFTEAVQNGDIIDVRRMSTTQQVTGITSPNGYMGFSADNNGAYVSTGTNSSNASASTYWEPTGGQVSAIANVVISSSGVATGVDSFSATTYRTAKYIIQATNGSNYESKEVLLVQNGSTAYITQYGTVNTGTSLGVITASVNAGVVTLSYNANNNNTTIRLRKEYMLI
jgi:hypothetical protein